ncbi:MAG: hypothetical protein CMG57_05765 [Candidatus Marinimicrobia bacterium]|nr:hypothetical protein [Candidatus Neomarinimicrobiota bacterium]
MKKLLFIFLFSSFLFPNNRLRLKKANMLENKTINGESVKFISGDVIFTKGTLTLNCQEGRHYEREELAILYRQVIALQEGRTLTCDTLKFYSDEDKIISIGIPHVWDQDYDLKADSLTVFTEIDSGVALGNVILVQKGQIISADRIEYQKEPTVDGVSYIAYGNVTIKDSSRIATCGKAKYDRTNENTTLEIEPEITDNGRILSGEKIILTYKQEELEKLYIPKKAFALTPVSGYKQSKFDSLAFGDSLQFHDKMEGSQLTGHFIDGILDSLRIEGMAKTIYHVFDDSVYQGKNIASGDTITMAFLEDELDLLRIIGGSEGKYVPDSIASDVDMPVVYSADEIKYRMKDEESDFNGKANIKHDATNLEAGFITVNWKTQLLNAIPKLESDSLSEPLKPIIKEKGKDPMTGDAMTYNLGTKKGKVTKGHTKADDGYYSGKQINNETNKIFFIESSTYTTCDLDTAHFHFESEKMKIIQNDIVIARPIILHLGQIPIFGIPLGIFPHKGGQRHSGWIMPSYGDTKNRGQYLQGLGFYWAPSEYWDSKLTLDFSDRQGAIFKTRNVYRIRYKFNGSFNLRNQQYLNQSSNIANITDARKTSTNIKWTHSQKLRNHQNFNANVTYSSSGDYDFSKKYGQTEADRMNQKAISNMSYSKRWPKLKNSLSVSYYSNRDLLIDDKINPDSPYFVEPTKTGTQLNRLNRTFPKLSFRRGQSNFFPTTAKEKKWYNTITWNYGLNYSSKDRDFYESVFKDSLESFGWNDEFENEQNRGWVHTSSINAPHKIFKYIAINPRMSLKSVWVDKSYDGIWNDSTNTFDKSLKEEYEFRTTGSFSMNTNTQIYGLFPIPLGPIRAIRHVMSPSIGYSWTPDFSKPFFGRDLGYIITHTDDNGNEYFHDRFAGTLAGGTPRTERKSMNFSLNNVFQAKVNRGDDEKKIDLLTWRMSSSYNFAADSMNFSNIRSTMRSKIAGKLNLDLNMTHDFYQYNTDQRRRISDFNRNENNFISPRLTSARLSTGFRFSGKRWTDIMGKEVEDDTTSIDEDLSGPGLTNPLKETRNTLNNKELWRTNVSLSYSYTATNPDDPRKTFWANTNTSINLTKKWRMSYRARFDLIQRDLVNHSFNIHRDLHCWELSLGWTPTGIGQGVNFKLNVKSPTLKDIKIEKKSGVFSGPRL